MTAADRKAEQRERQRAFLARWFPVLTAEALVSLLMKLTPDKLKQLQDWLKQ